MKKVMVVILLFLATVADAAVVRTDFTGTITNGSFSGALVADWNTGFVSEFYADVVYGSGATQRYSIYPDYDMVEVVQNGVATQYWSDGHTNQYTGLFSFDFGVSRFERNQNGLLSVEPSPDWAMYLDISGGRWTFTDNKTVIVPCGSGYCWQQTSSLLVSGQLTSATTSPIPLPSAYLLFISGIAGISWVAKKKCLTSNPIRRKSITNQWASNFSKELPKEEGE